MRPVVPADESRVAANFGNLPLSFEPNQGQTDSQVKFLSRNPHYNLFLTSNEAVFTLPIHSSTPARVQGRMGRLRNSRSQTQAVLRMQIVGANATPSVEGEVPSEGHTNYLTGRDSSDWVRNVPQYGRVHYRGVYPGVDMTFYGQQRRLEFDFIVKPGADPAAIALGIQGAKKIWTDQAGDLVLTSAAGDLRLHKPVAYQKQGEVRQPVDAHFVVKNQEVALAVGDYDRARELVIDPSIAYSTFLGGGNEDDGFGIAVDSTGAAYITGQTLSSGFPKTTGPTFKATQDAFVTKFKSDGSAPLLYSTFLAATGKSSGSAITIDSLGNAYVVGSTTATDFPTTPNAAQGSNKGTQDAFVAVLNPTGTLIYSTFLGGANNEFGFGIAVDALGNIYAAGETDSSDFTTTVNALQGSNASSAAGGADGFVTKIKALPDGGLAYSSYLGGGGDDVATGVAVDATNNIYVSGITKSTNFPTANAFQPCGSCNGTEHAFVTAIPATFTPTYIYSTYLRGAAANANEDANFIAVDSSSNAYVVGQTTAHDFPTTSGAVQTQNKATTGSNVFVTKLGPTGSAPLYSTYLGGTGSDFGLAIALDSAQHVYITGQTTSGDFPTKNPVQSASGGGSDGFVAELDTTVSGSAGLLFSTYLGGKGDENTLGVVGIAVDKQSPPNGPNIYVTGQTHSADFPFTAGAFQTASGSTGDAFVVKYSPQTLQPQFRIDIGAVSPSTIARGSTGTATVTVTSTGFVGNVPLICSITPTAGAPTCSITGSPVNLASNGGTGTASLTITTTKPAVVRATGSALWLPLPGLVLAGAGLLSIPQAKKKMLRILLGTLAFTGLLLMMACGSGNVGGGGGGGGGGTPPGSYTVTVQGGVNGTPGTATFSVQ
jgi:hypothetical protein